FDVPAGGFRLTMPPALPYREAGWRARGRRRGGLQSMDGVYCVLATPFDARGDADVASLRPVVAAAMRAAVTGFTALGGTSVALRITEHDRGRVLDTVMTSVAGRVPVAVGTTADGLHTCLAFSRQAASAGAAAIMVSPPRAPKLN